MPQAALKPFMYHVHILETFSALSAHKGIVNVTSKGNIATYFVTKYKPCELASQLQKKFTMLTTLTFKKIPANALIGIHF